MRIEDERKFSPFSWDEEVLPTSKEPQTQEQLTKAVMSLARAYGAKEGTRKPDDPPTILAPKYMK